MVALQAIDVGDGLCLQIRTMAGENMLIDLGSQQGGEFAWQRFGDRWHVGSFGRPDVFVLSHFHADHYNGLVWAPDGHRPDIRIRKVYFPRLPDLPDPDSRVEIFRCLVAMNYRILGNETGVQARDLLNLISGINQANGYREPLEYRPLHVLDEIVMRGSRFEVLSPPVQLADPEALSAIGEAIQSFHQAMAEDPDTDVAYEQVREAGVLERYLGDQGGYLEPREGGEAVPQPQPREGPKPELPEAVRRANQALRRAANHLGLALCEDNRFLFMGDAERRGIADIIVRLEADDRLNFGVMLAPHHGTQWHDSMQKLRLGLAICSSGPSRGPDMVPGLKQIASKCAATWVNGDVVVPVSGPPLYHHRRYFGNLPWLGV